MTMNENNIVRKLLRREIKGDTNLQFKRMQHVFPECIRRLGLEAELEGHQGCVNCLSWNEDGSLLVSGSDDVQLIIWKALLHKPLTTIRTGHKGNIFSAKFMPYSGDSVVVSGAADNEIRVHEVVGKETLHVLSCHSSRVKRLAVTKDQPHVFWSASEDGTVMQFDLRDPSFFKNPEPRCVLIDLSSQVGMPMEVKCLSINPAFSELLAVGANDPYARLYDRRMLQCSVAHSERFYSSTNSDSLPRGCVRYFVAGHLPKKQSDYKRQHRTLASTYITFSPNGRDLLTNLGGEHIYLFDINNERKRQKLESILQTVKSSNISPTEKPPVHIQTSNGFSHVLSKGTNGVKKSSSHVGKDDPSNNNPPENNSNNYSNNCKVSSRVANQVEEIRKRAKDLFEKQRYNQTVIEYNLAISLAPSMSVLYCNRAVALSKRNWDGDSYAAMQDCLTAIRLDDNNLKAHFRLAKCFLELSWLDEAKACLDIFQQKFSHSNAFTSLENEIKNAILNKKPLEDSQQSSSSPGSSSIRLREFSQSDNLLENEKIYRDQAFDYEQRFCGHCNTTTDIKESNFFGSDGQYIVAGSDDGRFFVWDRKTTNIIKAFVGDDSIVNCLEPHPTSCLLATSGIDFVVRLWSPRPDKDQLCEREVCDLDEVAKANQLRMNKDPLEQMLLNMGYRITTSDQEGRGEDLESPITCRTS